MSDSGNPSSALGDSVQQSNVSETLDSRTVPPPVTHPNVLAFQTTQDPALAGGTRPNAEHEPVIYDSRLQNPLLASPPVNVSDSPCAQSSALTVQAALASSPRFSQPVLTSSNAPVSRIQQVQSSTVERMPPHTPLLQPALSGSSDQQQLVPLVSGGPATPSWAHCLWIISSLSLFGLRSKKQASRAPVPRTNPHGHCYGRAVTCKEEVATLPTLTAVAAASRKPTTLQQFLVLV